MILTVCPNTAVDNVILLDEWFLGTTNRVDRLIPCVGGKGLNAAVALHHLKVESNNLGFFAGENGKELLSIIDSYGFQAAPIWVGGETRVSYVIVERKHQRHSHLTVGNLVVREDDEKQLLDCIKENLVTSKFVIFGGSLPPGLSSDFYYQAVAICNQAGIPCLVDVAGEPMLHAIKAGPEIVKMNQGEFVRTFNCSSPTLAEIPSIARRIYAACELKTLVITLGAQGILAINDNVLYHARCPAQETVNAAGAGDAVSAALAWVLSEQQDLRAALKMAAAVSAASVGTVRTADVDVSKIGNLLDQVEVAVLENGSRPAFEKEC